MELELDWQNMAQMSNGFPIDQIECSQRDDEKAQNRVRFLS